MRIKLLSLALLTSGVACSAIPIDGWYTNLFGGYTYLPDNISNTQFNSLVNGTGYNEGYNVGGRIGYQSHPIRYEAEYTYLHANASRFYLDQINQNLVTGYSSGNFILGNLYYDFPDVLQAISPYLGVGIGYGYISANLSTSGPLNIVYFNANDSVFAYQGTAGLSYNFSENYGITVAYRYLATDKRSNFGKTFQAQIASVGATYHFDHGSYK